MEDELIRKIKGGMLGIRNGTKKPEEVGPLLNKLRSINPGMYVDLFQMNFLNN